jgi:hypothetical protein
MQTTQPIVSDVPPEKKKRGRKPKPKPAPEERYKILQGVFTIDFSK